jgi:hypothetical protein
MSTAGKYSKSIKERLKDRPRPVTIPKLAEAAALVDKHSPKTIAQLGAEAAEANRPEVEASAPAGGLSPATLSGLAAIRDAAEEKTKKEKTVEKPPAKTAPTEAQAEPPPPPPPPKGSDIPLDDFDLERLLNQAREDILNNREQQDLIAKLVAPIDLRAGITSGVFEQKVPIIPDVLEIVFRSVTPFEYQAIRIELIDMCEQSPKLESVSPELYSAMATACSIKQVNGEAWAPSLVVTGGMPSIAEGSLQRRLHKLLMMPAPLMHAISVHSNWFDFRCREALKVTQLKSG